MARMLKFGGPNLGDGQHTWYERTQADGTIEVVRVVAGDQVPESDVQRAKDYVDRGQATFVPGKVREDAAGGEGPAGRR